MTTYEVLSLLFQYSLSLTAGLTLIVLSSFYIKRSNRPCD